MSFSPLINSFRTFTNRSRPLKSYYDILGVPSTATQADIKTAYYKLSMLYHPDKNQGSKEAAEKFQSISRAYEVLGNFHRRRLYDRGLLMDKKTEKPQSPPHETVYQKQKPSTKGRTPLYDFDEWSRAHYGKSFARRNTAKDDYRKESDAYTQHRRDQGIFAVILLIVIALLFGTTMRNSLDEPRKNDSPDAMNENPKKKNSK